MFSGRDQNLCGRKDILLNARCEMNIVKSIVRGELKFTKQPVKPLSYFSVRRKRVLFGSEFIFKCDHFSLWAKLNGSI